MKYLKWLALLLPHIILISNRYWVAWVAVRFFCTADGKSLQPWLSWLMTDDNDLGGDSGWRNEHIPAGSDPYSFANKLAWMRRNGFHHFNYAIIGIPTDKWWVLANYLMQDTKRFWQRPDGHWMLRGNFGPIYLFIGWSLFGGINGRDKFTATIKSRRK